MKDLRPGAGQVMTEQLHADGDLVGLLEAITTWVGSAFGPWQVADNGSKKGAFPVPDNRPVCVESSRPVLKMRWDRRRRTRNEAEPHEEEWATIGMC